MKNKNSSKTTDHSESSTIVEAIRQGLDARVIGNTIIYLDETASTNDEAKKLAEEGATEGTVIIAGTQLLGRGRLGRQWISPRGGAWMSVILRPASIQPLQKLTLLFGLSVAKMLASSYNVDARLKWPNDVLVGKKKICGILTEGSSQGEVPLFVVVGIGLNVNMELSSLPKKIRAEATTVRKVTGREVALTELIANLLKIMDAHYDLYARGKDRDLWREYASLCTTIGSEVRVQCGEEEAYEGIAEGISSDGGLIIDTGKGRQTTVLSGECIHLREKTIKNIRRKRGRLSG